MEVKNMKEGEAVHLDVVQSKTSHLRVLRYAVSSTPVKYI